MKARTAGWRGRRTPQDLARALGLALATDDQAMAAMGRAARQKVERAFAIESEAQGIIDVYDRLFAQYGEPSLDLQQTSQDRA